MMPDARRKRIASPYASLYVIFVQVLPGREITQGDGAQRSLAGDKRLHLEPSYLLHLCQILLSRSVN